MERDGITYEYALSSCKDAASADALMSNTVSSLQALGFDGSYKEVNQWTGSMTNDNGALVGAMVKEDADNPPYLVTTVTGSTS